MQLTNKHSIFDRLEREVTLTYAASEALTKALIKKIEEEEEIWLGADEFFTLDGGIRYLPEELNDEYRKNDLEPMSPPSIWMDISQLGLNFRRDND